MSNFGPKVHFVAVWKSQSTSIPEQEDRNIGFHPLFFLKFLIELHQKIVQIQPCVFPVFGRLLKSFLCMYLHSALKIHLD